MPDSLVDPTNVFIIVIFKALFDIRVAYKQHVLNQCFLIFLAHSNPVISFASIIKPHLIKIFKKNDTRKKNCFLLLHRCDLSKYAWLHSLCTYAKS